MWLYLNTPIYCVFCGEDLGFMFLKFRGGRMFFIYLWRREEAVVKAGVEKVSVFGEDIVHGLALLDGGH